MYDEAGHILGEYTSTGALIQETLWMGDTPVATLTPNGTGISIYYVHTDHLGTPRKITRPSDNGLMWRWDPDTFGSVSPNTNPAGLGTFNYNLRFPGQYVFNESSLYYNYYRDYDPQTGRYIESDPIGLKGDINPYGYARSNAVALRDPFGLSAKDLGEFVDKAIVMYKKVCKQGDEDCQHYGTRIYKMCVTSGYGLTGVACKLVQDHFVDSCIEDPTSVTCRDNPSCAVSSSSGGTGVYL